MPAERMTIGQVSRRSGVTPRAIRHYEQLGLIRPPFRSESNYRFFDSESVSRLRFIAKCRSLGFSTAEIADLLSVTDDPNHTCAQVEEITTRHLELIDAKLQSLTEMRETLAEGLAQCSGRDVPDCAVLDLLERSA